MGWVKIDRSIMDDTQSYFSGKFDKIRAWLDLLLMAHDSDTPKTIYVRGIAVEVNKGQIAISSEQLATRWQWSRTTVEKFLTIQQNRQQISQQKSFVTTLISITNYDNLVGDYTADYTANFTTEKENIPTPLKENIKINPSAITSIASGFTKSPRLLVSNEKILNEAIELQKTTETNGTELDEYYKFVLWMKDSTPILLERLELMSEKSFQSLVTDIGLENIKDIVLSMNSKRDSKRVKDNKVLGQTIRNWARIQGLVFRKMKVENPNDEKEVKYVNWINTNYPQVNMLKNPLTYKDFSYLIENYGMAEVCNLIKWHSGRGFKDISNLKDAIESTFLRQQQNG